METADIPDLVLIEDNPLDAEIAMRALRKSVSKVRITWLKDGAEALSFFFESSSPYPLRPRFILLDLKLPLVDGFEVLQKLKSDGRTACIPVVIMTSSREECDLTRCYRSGANGYVVKPVQFQEFADAMHSLASFWLGVNQSALR